MHDIEDDKDGGDDENNENVDTFSNVKFKQNRLQL
jgi:hypothetical protein